MHFEVEQKYYLRQKKKDDGVHPVLDSLDNYKILSERMNVLTIYLPFRKIGIASNLRTCIVKTAVVHLIGPLGFDPFDDRKTKCAGLDYMYWKFVDLHVHENWKTFENDFY